MNLVNTTVFRLALRFAAVFVFIFMVAISSVYYMTFYEIEVQTDLELLHEMDELEIHHHMQESAQLADRVNNREQYGEHLGHFYALLDKNKKYIAGNKDLATQIRSYLADDSDIHYIEREAEHRQDDFILRIAYKKLPGNGYLVVAQESSSLYELREHTFTGILYAVLITIILALIIGSYMGRSVLSRINKINQGMDQSVSTNFKQLISVPEDNDEFQALTLKLNQMLLRIEHLLTGMRQVTDNIAHDLRSPLNRLRSRLEITLLQSRSDEEYREVMAEAIEDCDELINTFNSLLSIAQAEAGVQGKDWQPVDLVAVINHVVELYEIVAEERKLKLHWLPTESVFIDGNKELLAQAVSNLLENAIKYTPSPGRIDVSVDTIDGHPQIAVADSGPGIDAKDYKRVLERFQRLDSARSSPGNGLGLSLVNAVTKLHNAKLVFKKNQPGLRVELNF